MAQNKKIVNFYIDWLDTYESLSDEEAGQLIKHKMRYVNDLEPKAPNRLIELTFIPFKQTFKRDLKKYNERIERSRKGGLKSAEVRASGLEKIEVDLDLVKSISSKSSDRDTVRDKERDTINNSNFSVICLNDLIWLENICRMNKSKPDIIKTFIYTFNSHLITEGIQHKNLKEYKNHFNNWLRKQKLTPKRKQLGI